MRQLTPRQVAGLADDHIRMYTRRLASKSPMVNRDKTASYLVIWTAIKVEALRQVENGAFDYLKLSPAHVVEIRDALDSGEYDVLLKGLEAN